MKETKDYQNYTFKHHEELDGISAGFIGKVREDADATLDRKTSIGVFALTKARFDYVHNETGEPAKGKVSDEELVNYSRILNPNRTIEASKNPDIYFSKAGIDALITNQVVANIHVVNVDNGKGQLITDLQQEQVAQDEQE